MFFIVVETITAVLALAGLAYYLLALFSAADFVRRGGKAADAFSPRLSILKPVKGVDPAMYEGLASHCRQNYGGEYELLFGVSSLQDPAAELIGRLQSEFPAVQIRLIVCPECLGTNGKVSNLVQMVRETTSPFLLINDSDILVGPDYLTHVMAQFRAPRRTGRTVGMVTAPYIGRAHGTLGSRMEALGISTDFVPGVLTAAFLEGGIHFGLGSTLAVSREALDAIGGLAPLVDHLADDYELGARISGAGFEVGLAREVVATSIPAYTLSGFLAHQLRWARSTRDSRKLGYAGLIFTFGLPWAIATMVACGLSLWSFALFCVTLAARTAVALFVGVGLLHDGQVIRDLWLIPARDVFALGIWAWSFAGNTVTWRGERFTLQSGKLTRVTATR